jgi:hypothetical protein
MRRSPSLSTRHHEAVRDVERKLIIYGFSCSASDDHSIKALHRNNLSLVAVSVFTGLTDLASLGWRGHHVAAPNTY